MKKLLLITTLILTVTFAIVHEMTINRITTYKKIVINDSQCRLVFNDTISFTTDKKLLPYVEGFIADYISNGYTQKDLLYHADTYLGIYIDHTPKGKYGVTFMNIRKEGNDFTIITPSIVESPNKLRVLVYHEMGHKFLTDRSHCHEHCDQIFSAYLRIGNFYNDWEKQKKILFKRLEH